MYAIVRVCGKQYRVSENDTLFVSRLLGEAGAEVTLSEVLAVGGIDEPTFGSPVIDGASVSASIIEQLKGPKINGLTYKPKKNQRHHYGHRQDLTRIKIGAITAGK